VPADAPHSIPRLRVPEPPDEPRDVFDQEPAPVVNGTKHKST
jgi:hypothetical protein